MSDDVDFCYECNRDTEWAGEICLGCGREWGYPLSTHPTEPSPDNNQGDN